MKHPPRTTARASMSALLPTCLAALPLALFPLWNDLSYAHITKGKWEGLLGMAALMLLLVLGFGAYTLLRRRPLPRVRLGLAHVFALCLLGFVGLSALCGSYPGVTNARGEPVWLMGYLRYEGMAAVGLYLLVFLLCSLGRPNMNVLLALMAASLTAFCGIVAMQYAGLNPLSLFPAGLSTRTNYEFQGTIGNIDMVSGYLSVVVPMLLGGYLVQGRRQPWLLFSGALGMLLTLCMEVQSGLIFLAAMLAVTACCGICRREWRTRALGILAAACLCAALRQLLRLPWLDGTAEVCLQWSRTGLLLLLAAAVLPAAALTVGRMGGDVCARWVILGAALMCVAVLVTLSCVTLPESLGGLYEISEVLHGRGQDHFGSYRLGVWRNTLNIIAAHPLTGTGPDSFIFALRDQLNAAGIVYPENFDTPHNEYLALASNCGIPALLSYLALVGCVAVPALKRVRGRKELLVPLLGVGGYLVQAVFSFSICLVAPIFWAALGVLFALGTASEKTAPAL